MNCNKLNFQSEFKSLIHLIMKVRQVVQINVSIALISTVLVCIGNANLDQYSFNYQKEFSPQQPFHTASFLQVIEEDTAEEDGHYSNTIELHSYLPLLKVSVLSTLDSSQKIDPVLFRYLFSTISTQAP